MANPAIVVDFVANTKDLQQGFEQASGKAGKFGGKIKGLAFGAATAGFAALAGTIKTGVDEFKDAAKIGAQTDAVIKSTGKAAGVTADQVSALAGALMEKSGVDDEAIQSGENVLLTFTNIRNEAGKGKDIFNQTTAAALDMSVALGTDMKSASMTLGKALNDPIKGMTKLTKQGVTFTDAQKKQAEAMVKAGDTAGAQKIILAELNKEFGGSAEAAGKTLPGQLSLLQQQFSNLAGELVGKMVPAFTAILNLLLKHKTTVLVVAGVIAGLTTAVLAVSVATKVWNALTIVASAATKAWAAAQWLINVALSANPIGIVVVAIAALVAGLIIAYKTSDTFREIVDNSFNKVLAVIKTVWNWLRANWPLLLGILTGPIGAATIMIVRNWDTITSTVKTAVAAVKGAVTGAWETIRSVSSSVWNAVSGFVTDAVRDIKSALNGIVSWLKGFATATLTPAVNAVKNVFGGIEDAVTGAISGVKNAFNGLISWITGKVDDFRSAAGRVADAIKGPINAVVQLWNDLGIPRLRIPIPSIKIPGTKKKIGGGSIGFGPIPFPDIKKLAAGGVIDSPTLALVGEAGREIVAPEKLLRDIVGDRQVQVRVFIGDQELTSLVRAEIVDANTGLARTLLAGKAA